MSQAPRPAGRERPQFLGDDVKDVDSLRRGLNDLFNTVFTRLQELEGRGGVQQLPTFTLETGATVTPTVRPFAGGALRIACDFTPAGLVLLSLKQLAPAGQPALTSAVTVDWQATTGPRNENQVQIKFITGLAANSRYAVTVGVTRG